MPKSFYPDPYDLPRAWRTKDGRSITEVVGKKVKKRKIHLDGMACLVSDIDPIERSMLAIAHHRCQILSARLIDPDPNQPNEQLLRLHPASRWVRTFLIYVLPDHPRRSKHGIFVLPANEQTKKGAWSISLKELLPHKDAWDLLRRFRESCSTSFED
jgi:hypothetical protein